jgi:hypothetical protein
MVFLIDKRNWYFNELYQNFRKKQIDFILFFEGRSKLLPNIGQQKKKKKKTKKGFFFIYADNKSFFINRRNNKRLPEKKE